MYIVAVLIRRQGLHKRYLFMSRRVPATKPKTASRINNATCALISLPLNEPKLIYSLCTFHPTFILSTSSSSIIPFHRSIRRSTNALPTTTGILLPSHTRLSRIVHIPAPPAQKLAWADLAHVRALEGDLPLARRFFLGTSGEASAFTHWPCLVLRPRRNKSINPIVIVILGPRLRISVWSS